MFRCAMLKMPYLCFCGYNRKKIVKTWNLYNMHRFHMHGSHASCVDPECGGAVFRTPIEKSQNYRVSLQFWTRSPEKLRSYRASTQCRAIISTPAKRHFMAFRWRADDDPLIVVFGSSHHSSTKKKLDPLWQKFWICACILVDCVLR